MYRNIYYDPRRGSITLFEWDERGNRIATQHNYSPYLLIEGEGEYKSIYGTKLTRKNFQKQYDRYKYIKDTGIKKVYENLPCHQQFLVDRYHEENEKEDFGIFPLKVFFVDIETYSPSDAFPDASAADDVINVITIYDSMSDRFTTWGLNAFNKHIPDVDYHHCNSEQDLIKKFICFVEQDHCDVLSGWNLHGFDLPYIINRSNKILGENWTKKLSPVGNIYSRTMLGMFGKEQVRWYVDGMSVIDYLDVYKKFSMGLKESYKLDRIAELELGDKKVDYGSGSLTHLADNNWDTFVEYNIQDVRILKHLDQKLKFIDLIRMLSYTGLTTMEAAMGALSVINGATAVRGRKYKKCIPTFIRSQAEGKNPGAYVRDPLNGFQQSIISFDANSLYPNVMISLNMSPETKIGKIISINKDEVEIELTNNKRYTLDISKFNNFIKQNEISISKAKIMFSQKTKGLMPEILDDYYNKRVEVKKELTEYKKQLALLEKKISKLKKNQSPNSSNTDGSKS